MNVLPSEKMILIDIFLLYILVINFKLYKNQLIVMLEKGIKQKTILHTIDTILMQWIILLYIFVNTTGIIHSHIVSHSSFYVYLSLLEISLVVFNNKSLYSELRFVSPPLGQTAKILIVFITELALLIDFANILRG